MRYKLAALTTHPIQYQAPLFRRLAVCPDIDLMVYFCNNFGIAEKFDPGFSLSFKWDIPLLEGYNYKFLSLSPVIIKEFLRHRYDAVWIHGYIPLANWFAFLGAKVLNIPVLLRGESHLLEKRLLPKRILKRMLLGAFFKRISGFLAIGRLNKEYYLDYDVPANKIFSVPYAVDNDFFSKRSLELQSRRTQLKEQLGISLDLPVILYASKMIPRKRPMDLLEAYKKIQEKISAALVFVGDGRQRSTLEAYVKANNLKNVYFTGFRNQSELPDYFVIADVFVLPSTNEPWGLVINEAMNFNLPIITTDKVGAGFDLVRHQDNGFIYPAGDIDKLAECILRILEDPHLKQGMGKRSGEIISHWGAEEDIRGILSALEYVCNR